MRISECARQLRGRQVGVGRNAARTRELSVVISSRAAPSGGTAADAMTLILDNRHCGA
jgi:hypothetical protein